MKRLSPRALRRRAPVRPPIRLFLELLERRESPTDVLNLAAGLGVAASLYAGSAVMPSDRGVVPGVDAVLGAAEKPALWDRIPILSAAVVKADEISPAKQTPSEPPPQSAQADTPLAGQQFFVTLGGSPLADPFVDPLGQAKPKEVSAEAGGASAPTGPATPATTDAGGSGGGGGGSGDSGGSAA